MNSFGSKSYINSLNQIDTNRSNINRILNPSIRYYPVGDNNTVKPVMKVQERTAAESPQQSRQSGTGAGTAAADSSDMARTAYAVEAADMTGIPDGIQAPKKHKQKSLRNDTGFRLDFTDKSLLNGIIMAEVLGKPKYLKKGRWS